MFGTTLAPMAGEFGFLGGILTGFIHAGVVQNVGAVYSGMNLYNNGFSGGLIAIVLYPLILAVARHRKPVIENLDYFSEMEEDSPMEPLTHHEMLETESDIDPADPIGPPVDPPKVKNKTKHLKKERTHNHRHFFE